MKRYSGSLPTRRRETRRSLRHLKELAGENIHVDGSYPVDISKDITDLSAVRHNEYEEYDPIYKSFGDIAKEGF